jgi:hypothetical protein
MVQGCIAGIVTTNTKSLVSYHLIIADDGGVRTINTQQLCLNALQAAPPLAVLTNINESLQSPGDSRRTQTGSYGHTNEVGWYSIPVHDMVVLFPLLHAGKGRPASRHKAGNLVHSRQT